MLKPPALRKQQASLLQTPLTNQTKAPNLPVCVNQPTCCHHTRSTSRLALCFLAPSNNSRTITTIDPTRHVTGQRRPAVGSIYCSRHLPSLLCRLQFSSTPTSLLHQSVSHTSHILSLLCQEQDLMMSSLLKLNNHPTKVLLATMKSV